MAVAAEEDVDQEIVYVQLFSHMKILSRFLVGLPWNASYVTQFICVYLLKPEIVVALIAFLVLFVVCFSNEPRCRCLLKKLHLDKYICRKSLSFGNPIGLLKDQDTWNLQRDHCGVFALKGKRPRMEDRFSVLSDQESGISLYGIFDGHGGESAAEFVEKNLFPALLKKLQGAKSSSHKEDEPQLLTEEFARLLTEEILEIDIKLLSKVKANRDVAGTTALVAIVHNHQLIVANVGDSRGVICDAKGNAVPLSFDHKPQQLKERNRIKEAGGFITFNGVWRVAGILATSRALGDFPLKDRNLVIAKPDILTFDLLDIKPQFMILATDGLWDTYTNEDAVAHVLENIDEDYFGAKSIAFQAYRKGSLDNITVLIVDFRYCCS